MRVPWILVSRLARLSGASKERIKTDNFPLNYSAELSLFQRYNKADLFELKGSKSWATFHSDVSYWVRMFIEKKCLEIF